MIARLSDELVQELERAGNEPLRVENPHNHKRYVIVAEDRFGGTVSNNAPIQEPWSAGKNSRRFELIDKQIAGTITATELGELQRLQSEIDEYLRQAAPLPIHALRDLQEQLLPTRNASPES